MDKYLNKNKKSRFIRLTGLVLIMASFLLVPVFNLIAEESNSNYTNDSDILNVNSNNAEDIFNVNNEINNDTDVISNDSADPENSEVPAVTSDEGDYAVDLEYLNEEIDAKREIIEDLKKRAELYEDNVRVKQQEALTLQNQLSIIDLQVQQTENEIATIQEEIHMVNLEIDSLELTIAEKIVELNYNKNVLAEYLRLIYKYDQKTYLEVFMSNDSFSDFFDQIRYAKDLESSIEDSLIELKDAKADLEKKKADAEAKRDELERLTDELSASILDFGNQKQFKNDLLLETEESEERFLALLEEAKKEQLAAESEIYTLETKAREQLKEEGIDLDIDTALMWPVSPLKGISAYFHDPTYPYRRYFEHPAIDIPTAQGTVVRAAENGYIVRAKNAGIGYSYIMIVHNDELTTVYGHISRIDVAEDDYVVRGQAIGLSGGIPGTSGAGRLTTGAHLHFEVRSNGIPVNPLDYLPAL